MNHKVASGNTMGDFHKMKMNKRSQTQRLYTKIIQDSFYITLRTVATNSYGLTVCAPPPICLLKAIPQCDNI